MPPRPSTLFFGFVITLTTFLAVLLPIWPAQDPAERLLMQRKKAFVRSHDLTDLCLFTEASYTRHMATTDLSTPFQDSPVSLEHFPSGALAPPPFCR